LDKEKNDHLDEETLTSGESSHHLRRGKHSSPAERQKNTDCTLLLFLTSSDMVRKQYVYIFSNMDAMLCLVGRYNDCR
jgi:hypothetical protein